MLVGRKGIVSLQLAPSVGKLARGRRWRWNQLIGKHKFLWSPPSPATYGFCSDINFCWGLRLIVLKAQASLGASSLRPTFLALVKGLMVEK